MYTYNMNIYPETLTFIYIYIYIYIYISYLPTPPLGQDMTQGQFFKRSLTGLNSEFSFSWTSCLTMAEEPSLPYYFTHSWRENNWIHTFPKGISSMWNAISPGFELVSPCPIPATITITPRALPQIYIYICIYI